jgi:hypothetical protein
MLMKRMTKVFCVMAGLLLAATALFWSPPELFAAAQTYTVTEDNENNAGTGVADGDMGMSGVGSCLYNTDSRHPIEFNFDIGTNVPTTSAQLFLETWDVDYPSELDQTYVNGTLIGDNTGANNQWSNSVFMIPAGVLHAGKNLVQVRVDQNNPGGGQWCTWVRRANLLIDGGTPGTADIVGPTTDAPSYRPGQEVTVAYSVTTSLTSQTVDIEVNLRDPNGLTVAGTGVQGPFTVNNETPSPFTQVFTLSSSAVLGDYTAEVNVFDHTSGLIQRSKNTHFQVAIHAPYTGDVVKLESDGRPMHFVTTYHDELTAGHITEVRFRMAIGGKPEPEPVTEIGPISEVVLIYDTKENLITMEEDGVLLSKSCRAGQGKTIGGHLLKVNCKKTTAVAWENTVKVQWLVKAKKLFAGEKTLSLFVTDVDDATDGWNDVGLWFSE